MGLSDPRPSHYESDVQPTWPGPPPPLKLRILKPCTISLSMWLVLFDIVLQFDINYLVRWSRYTSKIVSTTLISIWPFCRLLQLCVGVRVISITIGFLVSLEYSLLYSYSTELLTWLCWIPCTVCIYQAVSSLTINGDRGSFHHHNVRILRAHRLNLEKEMMTLSTTCVSSTPTVRLYS